MCSRAGRLRFGDNFAEDGDGAFTAGTVDIAVGDEADGVKCSIERPDAVGLEGFAKLDGVETSRFAVEDYNIGFDGSGIDLQTGDLRDFAREEFCVGVVFVEALGRLFEGDKACRGENSGLTHAAAEHFAVDASFVDKGLRADDHGADGRAETFRKAEHDGVEIARHLRDGFAESDRGVEDAGSVEVNFQIGCVGVGANFVDLFGRIERAAGHVVRVFEADERRLRIVINAWADDSFDFLPRENAVVGAGDARHATGDGGHGSEFVEIDVAALFANDFVAVMRPDFDGDEIPHAAGGDEKRGFFAENVGSAFFEAVDGRIFEIDVIADFGFGHGAAHRGCRSCDGVAAKVDDVRGLGVGHSAIAPVLDLLAEQFDEDFIRDAEFFGREAHEVAAAFDESGGFERRKFLA